MASNENHFWASILVGTSPGWFVKPLAHHEFPRTAFSTANLYVYDTSADWFSRGFIGTDYFVEARQIMDFSAVRKEAALKFSHVELLSASTARSLPEDEMARRALTLCMFYMASGHTYQVVRHQYDSLQGHWLCLLYRFKNGKRLLRTAFKGPHIQAEPLLPHLVKRWALETYEEDKQSSNSPLIQQFSRGNSLVLPRNSLLID